MVFYIFYIAFYINYVKCYVLDYTLQGREARIAGTVNVMRKATSENVVGTSQSRPLI